MVMPEAAFFFLTLPFAIWAAWGDLKRMKISNVFNLTLFGVFLVSGLFLVPLPEYGMRLAIGLAALVVGFVLNARGNLGGGDAKYIAAFLPFVRPEDLSVFFLVLAMCLLAALLVHRTARRTAWVRAQAPDWKSWTAQKFPMGLGLSGALSFYLAMRAFSLPLAAAAAG
ncbi:hypothetical protein GE300_02045 [Rhodobacteraceae bacterium 2CG4]|uniref:Prepilin type IV endopeptidase peptidase domain-containing protein n=1 Tax=Halovulum marinum TaxID=2662447 RepID=A0A6L5YVZ6_9RHOB|nr:prepilin peptidase [Halovulum marinum]MSU88397.1 hypothetical protein [Halovulum marinum]